MNQGSIAEWSEPPAGAGGTGPILQVGKSRYRNGAQLWQGQTDHKQLNLSPVGYLLTVLALLTLPQAFPPTCCQRHCEKRRVPVLGAEVSPRQGGAGASSPGCKRQMRDPWASHPSPKSMWPPLCSIDLSSLGHRSPSWVQGEKN